jgi:hypothetical protein
MMYVLPCRLWRGITKQSFFDLASVVDDDDLVDWEVKRIYAAFK